jgi:hypothetical protein
MTMPGGELVNAELRAMGDVVPDLPDHFAEMAQTGLAGVAGDRGVVDELPGGLGGDGGTPG